MDIEPSPLSSPEPDAESTWPSRIRAALFVAVTAAVVVFVLLQSAGQETSGVATAADDRTVEQPSSDDPVAEPAQDEPETEPTPATIAVATHSPELTRNVVEVDAIAAPGATTRLPTTVLAGPACVVPDTAEAPETEAVATDAADAASTNEASTALAGAVHFDGFEDLDPTWQVLSGSWAIEDGRMVQSDTEGYDRIAGLGVAIPPQVRVDVQLQAISGQLGGGLVVAQPTPMTRAGAFMIDFTEGGRYLRWGGYDATTGVYAYLGGVALPAEFDPTMPHRLGVELTQDATVVYVDDAAVGTFGALQPGRVGLVTSLSSVAFDNFTVQDLSDASA